MDDLTCWLKRCLNVLRWVVECVSGLELTFYNQLLGLSSKFLVNSCPPTNGDGQKVFIFQIENNLVSKKCKTKIRFEAQLARLASASLTNPLVAAQMRNLQGWHGTSERSRCIALWQGQCWPHNAECSFIYCNHSCFLHLHITLKVQTVLISVQCPLAGTRVA